MLFETINLKTAIVIRTTIHGKEQAFTTRTLRGERRFQGKPQIKDLVLYKVTDFVIDATFPWFTLPEPVSIDILWSNVIGVQYEATK